MAADYVILRHLCLAIKNFNKGLLIDLSVPSRFSVSEHEYLKIV